MGDLFFNHNYLTVFSKAEHEGVDEPAWRLLEASEAMSENLKRRENFQFWVPVDDGGALQVSFRQACASASLLNTSGGQFSLSAWRIRSCWLLGAMPPIGGSRSRLVGKE
jgi:hypothetical protein